MKYFINDFTFVLESEVIQDPDSNEELIHTYIKLLNSNSVSNYPILLGETNKFFELNGQGSGYILNKSYGELSDRIEVIIESEFSKSQFDINEVIFYYSTQTYKEHLPLALLDSNLVDICLSPTDVFNNSYSMNIDKLRANKSLYLEHQNFTEISDSLLDLLNFKQDNITVLDFARLLYNDFKLDEYMRQLSYSMAQFKNNRGSEYVLRMIEYFFNLRIKIEFLYTRDYKTFKAKPEDLPEGEGDPYLTTHYNINFISKESTINSSTMKFIDNAFKVFLSLRFVKYLNIITSWDSVVNGLYNLGLVNTDQSFHIIKRYLLDGGSLYYKDKYPSNTIDCGQADTLDENLDGFYNGRTPLWSAYEHKF